MSYTTQLNKRVIAFVSTLLLTPQVFANTSIDLSFSSEAAKFGYYQEDVFSEKTQKYGAEYLYVSNKGEMISITGEVVKTGFESAYNLDIGMKIKPVYVIPSATTSSNYSAGLMMGGIAKYWFPTEAPIGVSAEFMLSPSILTFGDSTSMREFSLQGEIKLLPTASVFVDYRKTNLEINANNYAFDDSLNFGFRISFE